MALRPQDLLVAVKIALRSRQTYPELAAALGLSLSEAHAAVKRATAAGLISANRTANRRALLDFLVESTRGAFAPERGPMTRGMPTAHGAPPLDQLVERGAEPLPVWPDPEGTERGESFAPLYPSVPRVARQDPELYEALALIDALRGGRARDRKLAEDRLRKMILSEVDSREVARTRYSLVEPRREKIIRLLGRLVGPGAVAWYQSALALLAVEPPIPATSHLVAHIATELESSVRLILGQVQSAAIAGQPSARHSRRQKRELDSHKKSIQSILRWLEIPIDGAVERSWIALTGSEASALNKRRHREDLALPRPIDPEFWPAFEEILIQVLDRFEARYVAVLDAFDRLAATPSPTEADAKKVKRDLPQTQNALAHFFSSLPTAAWIKPLASVGVFESPPEPERDATRSTHRRWHALEYLLRVASEDPATVAQIALGIRPSDNSWVNRTLAEIALALPAGLAAPFAHSADRWLTAEAKHAPSGLVKFLVDLFEKLAHGGEPDAAVLIFQAICAPVDPVHRDRPKSRLEDWDLMLAMSKLSPPMVRLGEPALRVSAGLLARIAVLHNPTKVGRGRAQWDDGSQYWRESVAEDHSAGDQDLFGFLVSLTRDIAVGIVESDPARLGQIIEDLEQRRWDIFHRLSLYLLARYGVGYALGLVTKRVLDLRSLRSPRLEHEYAGLLRIALPHLSRADQDRFLALIEAGPSPRLKGTPAAEAWIGGWLKVIEDDLPPHGRTRLDALEKPALGAGVQAHGSTRPPFRFAVGGKSPFLDDDLERLTTPDLIAAVRNWKPSDVFGGPDRTGLRNALTRLVGRTPEKYARDVSPFKSLEPFYLRGVVHGFTEAVGSGRSFDWAHVLELCVCLVSQLADASVASTDDEQTGADADRVDGWLTVLRLIRGGLQSSRTPIPIELRADVWSMIEPALADPHGATDDAIVQDDVFQKSINCVRSVATGVVVDYAVWLKLVGQIPGLSGEVRQALDSKVNERSSVVRAIFGERIGTLVRLDAEWCKSNVPRIFATALDREDVCWRTYLEWGHLDPEVFQVLSWKYDLAIDAWPHAELVGEREIRVGKSIGDHLGRLYWNGRLGLNDRARLLRRFLANAPAEVTADFFERIGRWLHAETPSAEVLARLRAIWEMRDLVGRREEAAAFSWWFSSGRFDETWALDQFDRALEGGGYLGFAPRMGEQLVELLPRHLAKVLGCLVRLLTDPEHHDWAVLTLRGSARTIVEAAISSSDQSVRQQAYYLISRLLARGHSEMHDLARSTKKAKA